LQTPSALLRRRLLVVDLVSFLFEAPDIGLSAFDNLLKLVDHPWIVRERQDAFDLLHARSHPGNQFLLAHPVTPYTFRRDISQRCSAKSMDRLNRIGWFVGNRSAAFVPPPHARLAMARGRSRSAPGRFRRQGPS
jgi:hypothetical protein